jgi:aminoglycoside 2'-N-acetyltransferase I
VPYVRTMHTADLDGSMLTVLRALLDDAFDGELRDQDWEHALGGMHAVAWEEDEIVGHAAVVQRRLLHRGRALRTGYVEAVGVRPDRRRRGHGAALMTAIERIVRGAYELGALGTTDEGADFYRARGWRQWEGATSALTPAGIVRTQGDDDSVHVLPVSAELDLAAELTCDWRDGDAW